jgi:hypothetical protein
MKERSGNSSSGFNSTTNKITGSALSAASLILASEFKVPSQSVHAQLKAARDHLGSKLNKLSPKTKATVSTLSPYYADLTRSRFAVQSTDFRSPYDMLVAAVAPDQGSSFCEMEGIELQRQDQLLIEELLLHTQKLDKQPFDLAAVDSAHSAAYQNLDSIIANLFYKKKYGTPLLGFILRERKKPPKYYGPNYYHKCLVGYLQKTFTSADSYALANTVARLLEAAIDKKIDVESPRWTGWISARNSRIPTYEQLVHIGISPELKLKKYRTLFFQSEWDHLNSEKLLALETEISEQQRTAVGPKNLDELIRWSKKMKEELSKSSATRALLIKQKRLTLASRLRGAKTLDSVVKEGIQNSSEASYFTPFFIVANGENFSEGELLSRVVAVDENGHYAFRNDDKVVPSRLQSAGMDYSKIISN